MDIDFSDLNLEIDRSFSNKGWTTIFSLAREDLGGNSQGIFCGLATDEALVDELKSNSWGLHFDSGRPGLTYSYEDGEQVWSYDRLSENSTEPLLIYRYHPISNKRVITISEEFQLYFNLFKKCTSDSTIYYWIDDNAESHDVVVITNDNAKIKTKFLRVYINVRKVNLCIYFDNQQFSEKTIIELGLTPKNDTIKSELSIYSDGCRDISDLRIRNDLTQSWMMGKVIIPRDKNFIPNDFDHFDSEEHEIFNIGYDDTGEDLLHTCDKSKLSDYYNQIEGAPFFLTPVYFNRDVLKKYYDQPNLYTVSDGRVCLDGFWSLHVDNNIGDYVSVFLGDLSLLPPKEQKYWKSYNIPPKDGVSATNIKRAINGQFADPDAVDNYFKQKLQSFTDEWFKKFNWHIFKPLTTGDLHYLTSLHVPSPENAKEFEEQILGLTKIVIDSLNDKELVKNLVDLPKDAKRLEKFDAYLEYYTGAKFEGLIEYLRMLQRLRSTSVAHRKSSKADKKVISYFELDTKNYYETFQEILLKAIWIFNTLETHFLKD